MPSLRSIRSVSRRQPALDVAVEDAAPISTEEGMRGCIISLAAGVFVLSYIVAPANVNR